MYVYDLLCFVMLLNCFLCEILLPWFFKWTGNENVFLIFYYFSSDFDIFYKYFPEVMLLSNWKMYRQYFDKNVQHKKFMYLVRAIFDYSKSGINWFWISIWSLFSAKHYSMAHDDDANRKWLIRLNAVVFEGARPPALDRTLSYCSYTYIKSHILTSDSFKYRWTRECPKWKRLLNAMRIYMIFYILNICGAFMISRKRTTTTTEKWAKKHRNSNNPHEARTKHQYISFREKNAWKFVFGICLFYCFTRIWLNFKMICCAMRHFQLKS